MTDTQPSQTDGSTVEPVSAGDLAEILKDVATLIASGPPSLPDAGG